MPDPPEPAAGRSPWDPVASGTVDVGALANILLQARGPILDRISRHLPKFSGADRDVDASAWLTDLERWCILEKVSPVEIIPYMLEGNATRVYRRMLVGDASQWDVVKSVLLAEYAMPLQEAGRRWVASTLWASETLDVYVDDLDRLGSLIGLGHADLFFRIRFYEGLPASLHEWAVSREDAYTCAFPD